MLQYHPEDCSMQLRPYLKKKVCLTETDLQKSILGLDLNHSLRSFDELPLTPDAVPVSLLFLVKSGGVTYLIFSLDRQNLSISIRSLLIRLSLSNVKFSLRYLSQQLYFICQFYPSSVDSKFGPNTQDLVLSSNIQVKNLCFRKFFLGVREFCWSFLLHGLCDFSISHFRR